jgi:hypothetical protein
MKKNGEIKVYCSDPSPVKLDSVFLINTFIKIKQNKKLDFYIFMEGRKIF